MTAGDNDDYLVLPVAYSHGGFAQIRIAAKQEPIVLETAGSEPALVVASDAAETSADPAFDADVLRDRHRLRVAGAGR